MTDALYLPFYYEWAEYLSVLPDAEYGMLVKAIMRYAMGDEQTPELSPASEMAFKFIVSAIRRSEANRLNGRKGGRARAGGARAEEQGDVGNAKKAQKTDALPTYGEKTELKERRDAETHEKTNEIREESSTIGEKAHPTIEQVRKYFRERGFDSDPDEFFHFYESNGWLVGQNPMKNWCASATKWEIKAKREQYSGAQSASKPHGEAQRQGSFDVDEAFRLALERSYGPNADDDGDD